MPVPVPRLLSVLTPALVFGGAWALATYDPGTPPPPDAKVRALIAALDREPDVIVVGNSQAMGAVDADQLSRELDATVANVSMPGATTALTWALLKHAVFDAGHHPRLIVIPMALGHLVDTSPPFGAWHDRLAALTAGPDPVLDAKVFGRRMPALERALDAARAGREAALQAWARLPAYALGLDDAQIEEAAQGVLGGLGGMQMAAARPALSVTDLVFRPEQDVDLDHTLLPDLFALAEAHGTRIVVATVPQHTSGLRSSPPLVRRVASWAREHKGALLHLETAPVPSSGWLDDGHVNEQGRAVFTHTLGAALLRSHAVLGPLVPPALPPPLPTVTREGPPPPTVHHVERTADPCLVRLVVDVDPGITDEVLDPYGFGSPLRAVVDELLPRDASRRVPRGCTGSAWVEPGAVRVSLPDAGVDPATIQLRWEGSADAPEAWWVPAQGSLRLSWRDMELPADATLRVMLVAPTGQPAVTVDGQPVPLTRAGNVWLGAAPVRALSDLTVTSTGGPAFVSSVLLDAPEDSAWLVGGPSFEPDRAVASHLVRAMGGPYTPGQVVAQGGADGRFAVSPADALVGDHEVAAAMGPKFGSCSPFLVRNPDNGPRGDVMLHQGGPTTLLGEGPAPTADWALTVSPQRRCRLLQWAQPGETLRLEPDSPAALHAGADQLTITLHSFPPGQPVSVSVWQGRATHTEATFAADGLPHTLPVALAPSTAWVVDVTAPDGAWVLTSEPEVVAASARDALAAGEPTPPASMATIPVGLPDALQAQPEGAVLQRTAEVFHAEGPAEDALTVCWADVPAAFDQTQVRLRAQPPTATALFVRWLDAEGRLLTVGSGEAVTAAPSFNPVDIHLRATPPPGASTAKLCVRRGRGASAIDILAWSNGR